MSPVIEIATINHMFFLTHKLQTQTSTTNTPQHETPHHISLALGHQRRVGYVCTKRFSVYFTRHAHAAALGLAKVPTSS